MEDFNQETLRQFLTNLLEEKKLSIRKLSKLSGIDHATISKIMNGHRKCNLAHLEKLAIALDVELYKFMEAAGYQLKDKDGNSLDLEQNFFVMQNVLKSSGVYEGDFTIQGVEQQLSNYEQYSQTEEGKKTILYEFEEKLNKTSGVGPYIDNLRKLHRQFQDKRSKLFQHSLVGGALLYFIVTPDVMPDYLFPIGYVDDGLVVQMTLQKLDIKR